MTTRPTIEPSGRRHIRRIQRDSQIVGLTIKNEYGDWVLYDAPRRPMTSSTFKSPKLALDAFLLIEMPSSTDNPHSAERYGTSHKKSTVRTVRLGLFGRHNMNRLLFSRKTFKALICLLLSFR